MPIEALARRFRRGRLLLALGLVLTACGSDPQPPPPAPAPPEPIRYTPPPVTRAEPPPPPFCPVLAGMVAREAQGYAALRGQPLEPERWRAAATPPGVDRCMVEGQAWPQARVTCEAGPVAARERAVDEFELLAHEIDACLARPTWFPRSWERGQLFEFALGERQLAWLDQSSRPPTAVVLKVQQDIASRDYRIKLNLETVR